MKTADIKSGNFKTNYWLNDLLIFVYITEVISVLRFYRANILDE